MLAGAPFAIVLPLSLQICPLRIAELIALHRLSIRLILSVVLSRPALHSQDCSTATSASVR